MKKGVVIWIVVAIVVMAGGWLLLSGGNKTAQETGTIKIGIIAPMSGEFAVFGENMTKGIQLAKDEYLAKHPGQKVDIIIEDDQGAASKAVSAYSKLQNLDQINALISATLAASNDAIYEAVKANGGPAINIGVSGVGPTNDNVFQSSPDGNDALVQFAQYLIKNKNYANAAIVYEDSVAGNDFYKAFSGAYSRKNTAFINQGKETIRNTATKIAKGNFDAAVFLMNPQSGALLTKEILAQKGDKEIALVYDAQLQTGFADYQRILGNTNKINGALSSFFKGGDATSFVESYKERYRQEPGFLADFGYDTFIVLMNSFDSSQDTWIRNIKNIKYSGPSGEVAFDQNGVRLQPIEIKTVQGGTVVSLKN